MFIWLFVSQFCFNTLHNSLCFFVNHSSVNWWKKCDNGLPAEREKYASTVVPASHKKPQKMTSVWGGRYGFGFEWLDAKLSRSYILVSEMSHCPGAAKFKTSTQILWHPTLMLQGCGWTMDLSRVVAVEPSNDLKRNLNIIES